MQGFVNWLTGEKSGSRKGAKGNDECGMMNDELKAVGFSFIIHHSAFIISYL
jgi:hypothetical protein